MCFISKFINEKSLKSIYKSKNVILLISNGDCVFLHVHISTMAPKNSKKAQKPSLDKHFVIFKYKKKVEAKIDKFNIITIILTNSHGEYILELVRKALEGAHVFPYSLAKE